MSKNDADRSKPTLRDGLPEPSEINKQPMKNRLPRTAFGWLGIPLKFLFGNDIFISYSRADGINYAEGLASQLAKRNFSCSLDLWETSPGRQLPKKLKRAVRWSKMLVIIGTGSAAGSPNCELEVEEFARTKGTIIPIDFDHAVDRALWFQLIQGLPIARETNADALVSGRPSEGILSRIENSFKFTRRNRRAQRIFIISLLAFAVLIVLNLLAGRSANASRADANMARAEAENQNTLAGEAKRDADAQRQLAQAASEEKEKQRGLAAEAKADADKQRGLAEAANAQRTIAELKTKDAVEKANVASRNAAEQQRIAEERLERNRNLLYVSDMKLAYNNYETANMRRVSELLNAHLPAESPTHKDELRGFEWYYLWRSYNNEFATLSAHAGYASSVSFSSSGKILASGGEDGAIRVWDASVVRQTDHNLLLAARARFTFSRMSEALAVQTNGFGSVLCCEM